MTEKGNALATRTFVKKRSEEEREKKERKMDLKALPDLSKVQVRKTPRI